MRIMGGKEIIIDSVTLHRFRNQIQQPSQSEDKDSSPFPNIGRACHLHTSHYLSRQPGSECGCESLSDYTTNEISGHTCRIFPTRTTERQYSPGISTHQNGDGRCRNQSSTWTSNRSILRMGNRSEILSEQRTRTILGYEITMVRSHIFEHRGNCIFFNAVKWHFEEVGTLAITNDDCYVARKLSRGSNGLNDRLTADHIFATF